MTVGVREAIPPSEKRFRAVFPPADAGRLAGVSDLLSDHDAYQATLEATGAVLVRFGGKGRFVEPSAVAGGRPVVVCLLAHVAIVATKILAFLGREGGVGDSVTGGGGGEEEEEEEDEDFFSGSAESELHDGDEEEDSDEVGGD